MSDLIEIWRIDRYFSLLCICYSQEVEPFIRRLQIDFKNSMIDLRRKWAWHRTFEMNLICSLHSGTFLSNLVSLALTLIDILVFIQTYRQMNKTHSFLLIILLPAATSSTCDKHLHKVGILFVPRVEGC